MQKHFYLPLLFVFGCLCVQAQQLTTNTLSGLKLRTIGPATMSGRIVDIAVEERNAYTFYVASATGGVWKTTNNGVTFTPVFEKESTHSVGAIAVHPAHPKFVWVGTGERANRQSSSWGDGIYKSMDGGKTWVNKGLPASAHIGRIVLHPADTNTVYVAAMGRLWGPNPERGLYKSTDGGNTWSRILYINEDTGVVDVAMDPSNPDVLYAASYQRRRTPFGFHGGGPGSGLYKSDDGGNTWTLLTNGLPDGDKGRIGISIYRKNPDIVYVCVEQGFQYNASTAYNERKAGVYRSEDKGATWAHMSDWNPRPMYASQILVDPNDDQRIYMQNSFSYSDDGGKTFTSPRQSLHGDDRFVWVNPADSRHLLKADDGGLGISYDRAKTWLYVASLPLSQFYRISADMRQPYNIYGGLQDNGSWMGPSATYRSEGILNHDWIKTGGGDGFLNLIHPKDEHTLYTESQYLGLSRLDLRTGQRRDIRPGDPKGHISARRNWDAWGPGLPEPELGNAMAPANWDAPFCISPHDANTLYAGTNVLWKSTDGGDSWTALGNLTTSVNRRELTIMDTRATASTASLDDGIPYYPTLTAIAESPLQTGVLYVGTDDGQLQVSTNGGQSWLNVSNRLPGLPPSTWINTLEVSRFNAGTAYAAINNYRNDDFANYLYKTTDFGQTWTAITGDLPPNRVVRTLREDPRNPDLLYLGTELGLFISINGGRQWVELKNNMPTQPFNDLLIHPRDNDLVLGTHGRGIWILDKVNALQELTPTILAQSAHLFTIANTRLIRYTREGGHTGDMIFRGENPPAGAIIDYYLQAARPAANISLAIYNSENTLVRQLNPDTTAGINRIIWDGRHARLAALNIPDADNTTGSRRPGPEGPLAMPGLYTARLTVNGQTYEQTFLVQDDPRLHMGIEDRRAWTETLFELGKLYEAVLQELKVVRPIHYQLGKLVGGKVTLDAALIVEANELDKMYGELLDRTRGLYGNVSNWMGKMTADQAAQMAYYQKMLTELEPRKKNLLDRAARQNRKLDKTNQIPIPTSR
ncbi:MAG TPA: hypothetical protein PKC76_05865 [Saprospiraceae bacterium]|nr:hypothetical protein [Saprospiraceae bacterium]HMP23637.1 hypothetical protein [Saprospiraceae bacterium]